MTARQLSHHEIWDDSALVSSWNEALEEYKKYHSIAAKGERVEDVLDAVEKEEEAASINAKAGAIDEATGLPPWQSNDSNESVNGEKSSAEVKVEEQPLELPKQQAAAPLKPPSSTPQALFDSVQDESLKSLMMSWYYAGYYTGLYEGQQKALQVQQDADQGK